MGKNVTLVSKDGEHEVTLPEDEAVEITQFRALGWATKPEHTAAVKAEKKAETAQ
jgi:hypothetical protein